MRDVAALAGVSLKTVSRVVNRETGVSTDVTTRVEGEGRLHSAVIIASGLSPVDLLH